MTAMNNEDPADPSVHEQRQALEASVLKPLASIAWRCSCTLGSAGSSLFMVVMLRSRLCVTFAP